MTQLSQLTAVATWTPSRLVLEFAAFFFACASAVCTFWGFWKAFGDASIARRDRVKVAQRYGLWGIVLIFVAIALLAIGDSFAAYDLSVNRPRFPGELCR
jgi:hypothetical protein